MSLTPLLYCLGGTATCLWLGHADKEGKASWILILGAYLFWPLIVGAFLIGGVVAHTFWILRGAGRGIAAEYREHGKGAP